jgi:hypothetical protein
MYSLVSRVHFKADTPIGEPLEMNGSIIHSAKMKLQSVKLMWSQLSKIPRKRRFLRLRLLNKTKLGVIALTCDPRTWERESEGSQV